MGDQYDLIILDPPAFAKHKDALRNALQGYRKLNAKAFEKIKPGGILFTFSCSQVVTKDNFRTAVFTAAAMSGRSVRILHQLTPACRPPGKYIPSRRRIPERAGTLCRVIYVINTMNLHKQGVNKRKIIVSKLIRVNK